MFSSIIFGFASITGILSILVSVYSIVKSIHERKRRKQLVADIIASLNELEQNCDTDDVLSEKMYNKIAAMLKRKYVFEKPDRHEKDFDKAISYYMNKGYSTTELLEKQISEILNDADKIDSGQELKSA